MLKDAAPLHHHDLPPPASVTHLHLLATVNTRLKALDSLLSILLKRVTSITLLIEKRQTYSR